MYGCGRGNMQTICTCPLWQARSSLSMVQCYPAWPLHVKACGLIDVTCGRVAVTCGRMAVACGRMWAHGRCMWTHVGTWPMLRATGKCCEQQTNAAWSCD
eukprot:166596-Chlamydomonas_euryale.AAC.1